MKKHPGIILFYLAEKDRGYLRLQGTREEFYFRSRHMLTTDLGKGDLVNFRLKQGKQGYYADEIERANLL